MSLDFLMNNGLSIVIPALDEPYLPILESKLRGFFYRIPFEILIRDDKGCGNAILAGIRESKFDTVLVMDADGSHSPLSAFNMYNYFVRNDYDLIYGYKKHSEDSPLRRMVTFGFDVLARIFVEDSPDLMSGFFIFDKTKINPLPETIGHPKVLMYIVKHNRKLRIGLYGIHFMKRIGGYSKLGKPRVAYEIIKGMLWR